MTLRVVPQADGYFVYRGDLPVAGPYSTRADAQDLVDKLNAVGQTI